MVISHTGNTEIETKYSKVDVADYTLHTNPIISRLSNNTKIGLAAASPVPRFRWYR